MFHNMCTETVNDAQTQHNVPKITEGFNVQLHWAMDEVTQLNAEYLLTYKYGESHRK